jgi:CspA family cold shock protein
MISGKVLHYSGEKGFGVIAPDDGGHGVFVHATALERAGIVALAEGQAVNYRTQEDGLTGKAAVTILRIARAGDICLGDTHGQQTAKPSAHRQGV